MSSSKPPRVPPTPSPTPGPHHGSKLPKFMQKSANRDRSRSVIEPIMNSGSTSASADSSIASSSSSASMRNTLSQEFTPTGTLPRNRRVSRLKGTLKELKDDRIGQIRERDREQLGIDDEPDDVLDDMPVIIEPTGSSPALGARPRTRAERPLSASSSDSHPGVNYYHSGHSSQKLSDMGTRLSGWFSHTFSSSSSTDLSLPAILANTTPVASSPTKKAGGGLGILTAAKHGKGHLDKAMRYLLDSDATPDKCTDPIWLLGVEHPGYEPPPPPSSEPPPSSGRRSSMDMRRSGSIRSSISSIRGATSSPEPSLTHQQRNPGANWPPGFYADFTTRIWLTYRSHYHPIRDHSLAQLEGEASGQPSSHMVSASPRKWGFLGGGEKGWTSDSGWGCMLRTGQSLLANALIHLHLGRDWRRPPHPVYTADYAEYIKILTWFFDSPDAHCPFSVHRMALAGKDMGTDVGQWFGPSIAAGSIKKLVDAFPEAGLGVSVAMDNVVYETDVLAASNVGPYLHRLNRAATSSPSTRRKRSENNPSMMSVWGQRPVLVLVGVRLGFDAVNPKYYEYVKTLFTLPQSVGIAGGRPSSSYYFVGTQSDSLFYLDPHHTRPAVALRPPPPGLSRQSTRDTRDTGERPGHRSNHTSPSPADSPPSSYRDVHSMPMSLSSSMNSRHARGASSVSSYHSHLSPSSSVASMPGQPVVLDPLQEHYVTSYSPVELRTFHCDRVRKMPLSGLDPSMLLGFLCRDERDWSDLREKITTLNAKYKTVFSIQDEPPSWPSDSDEMGMESVSDIDMDTFSISPEEDEEEGQEPGKEESDSGRRSIVREDSAGRQSEEVTTEEDAADPVTPGLSPSQGFREQMGNGKGLDEDLLGDDEEWVDPDPCMPTPRPRQGPREAPSFPVLSAVPLSTVSSTSTDASYVSASSSYSDFPEHSPSPVLVDTSDFSDQNGTQSSEIDNNTHDKAREKDIKGRRTPASPPSRIRSSKSGGRSKREASTTSNHDYVPFPVVDDREPEDAASPPDSPDMRGERPRTETGTSVNRTPIASVVMQRDANASTDTTNLGYRVRNVFGRDGGRTQSGGVRGIVASEVEDLL